MQFPIGGKVRERKLIWCKSKTDSIVWMEEEWSFYLFVRRFLTPEDFFGCFFFILIAPAEFAFTALPAGKDKLLWQNHLTTPHFLPGSSR